MICSVQKCNSLFCDVGCHVFRNRQRKNLVVLVYIMLESYIFRQISARFLPKTKSSTIVET